MVRVPNLVLSVKFVVVETVVEIAWLMVCHWVAEIIMSGLTLCIAAVAIRAVAAVWTIVSIGAAAAFRTLTALSFSIAFWFGLKHAVREFVFASLWVYLHQFHLDLVTLLYTSVLHCFKALPFDFGDV